MSYLSSIGLSHRSVFTIGLSALGLAALAVYFPLGLLIVVAGALGVVALRQIFRDPFSGVVYIAFLLPFERVGGVELGGSSVRLHQLVALLTIGSWLGQKLARGRLSFRANPLFWPLFGFILANSLALLNSINLVRGFLVLGFTVFVILTSLMVSELVDSRERLYRVIRTLIISALLVSLFGLFQFVGDELGLPASVTMIRWGMYNKEVLGMTRLHSTALEPLYFTNYLLVVIPLVVALIMRGKAEPGADGKDLFSNLFLIVSSLIMELAFVLTLSRGGYVALAVSLMAVFFFRFRHLFSKRMLILISIVGLAGLGVVAVVGFSASDLSFEYIAYRATHFGETSADRERLATYNDAWQIFLESPWLGVGPGNFGPYMTGLDQGTPDRGWGIVNNEYLELLAEVGLIGSVCLGLALLIWLYRNLLAQKRSSDPMLRVLLIGSLATAVGFSVQYLTFSTLYIMHIWFALGLGTAIQQLALAGGRDETL